MTGSPTRLCNGTPPVLEQRNRFAHAGVRQALSLIAIAQHLLERAKRLNEIRAYYNHSYAPQCPVF